MALGVTQELLQWSDFALTLEGTRYSFPGEHVQAEYCDAVVRPLRLCQLTDVHNLAMLASPSIEEDGECDGGSTVQKNPDVSVWHSTTADLFPKLGSILEVEHNLGVCLLVCHQFMDLAHRHLKHIIVRVVIIYYRTKHLVRKA